MRHEPLRATGIFTRQSHAHGGSFVRNLIDFAAYLITRPSILVAARVAGLHHEIRHYSRNCLSVEISSFSQLNKIIDGQGRLVREKSDCERATTGHDGCGRVVSKAGDGATIILKRIPGLHCSDAI